jgi:hypothetical protein
MTATVYSRDPFMGLQETGGTKQPLGRRVFDYGEYLAIPLDARKSKSDIVRRNDWPANLVEPFIVTAKDGRKYLAVRSVNNGKRGIRSVSALRKGRTDSGVKLMYTLVPKAQVRKRLFLVETARKQVPDRFPVHFARSLTSALATAA